MNGIQNIILISIMLAFAGAEIWTRRYEHFHATKDDGKLELFMFISLLALIQPVIFAITKAIGTRYFPESQDALASLPWWAMFGILLIGDDMTQYWWHRLSHTPLLWPLHRAHHTAQYMSIRVTYRNNFFYYAMMPGLWISGALIYTGFAQVYMVYLIIKLTVILGAHCAVAWDAPLYRIKALSPVMWLVERTTTVHLAAHFEDGVIRFLDELTPPGDTWRFLVVHGDEARALAVADAVNVNPDVALACPAIAAHPNEPDVDCGCRTGSGGAPWAAVLGLLAVRRRRR